MVTVTTSYLAACSTSKQFETIDEAMYYVNSTIEQLNCFYRALGYNYDLNRKEVPGSINRVIQCWATRYTVREMNSMVMIVLFRIEEGKK